MAVKPGERSGGTKPQINMEAKMQYRQGDVLVERVEALPANIKPEKRDNGRVVLAYGEVTGHAHAITEDRVESFVDDSGELYLSVSEPAELTHEEHTTISLPVGFYRVVRQREYSPEEIRRVAD